VFERQKRLAISGGTNQNPHGQPQHPREPPPVCYHAQAEALEALRGGRLAGR
jgi:hypothetical protein